MSKRSSFGRIPRDLYESVDPRILAPNFLSYITGKMYYEPSCGSGKLINQLAPYAVCGGASDIEPLGVGTRKDGLYVTIDDVEDFDYLITNPPYKKDLLLPLIDHWSSLIPTWLLLPADLAHNGYMVPYMKKCERVVSVGRLYFFLNEWVVKEPFDHDELDTKWDSQIEFYDSMKGIKYYTGYLTNQGKPCKTEFVRGTDNYAFYLFQNYECDTVYETRGDN